MLAKMFQRSFVLFGAVCFCVVEASHERIERQSVPEQGGHVIDSIFNIPITAIKQTAAAAQNLVPDNSQAIDSILQIPVSTLEAVGNLVKATSGQRRQTPEELQQIRQQRRDRVLAQRERQRVQRELAQQQRLKQQQSKRTIKINKNDPFGLNTLSDILVGNHGFFGGYGGHGGHGGLGGHGGHGMHGMHGGQPSVTSKPQHTYEVHENVDEDTSFQWHGITAGFGSFFGSRPTGYTIQNKIAPKEQKPNKYKYAYEKMRLQNGAALTANGNDRVNFEDDPPLQNKIAPRSGRITFQS